MPAKHLTTVLGIVLSLGLADADWAPAQCILSNPSFEIGDLQAAGWNPFGDCGLVAVASHGTQAARVSGPNIGDWGLTAYWQSQDCAPGEQWEVTGHVQHPSSRPLTGQNSGLVNVEWRDDGGVLLDYQTFVVALATTPTDEYHSFSVVSTPAPAGTVETRLLVGTLQSPSDPVSDVYYDQVTFSSTTAPTIDDVQWLDFPGGRTFTFGGQIWRVKGPGYFGPGPNVFSDATDAVWIDANENLHLTLTDHNGTWASTEVVVEEALGYGEYIVTTVGQLDLLDPQAVLGIFLWQYGPCYDYSYTWWNAYNEVDIEYSRWQDPGNDLAQFVAQPYDWAGNLNRFDASFGADEVVSHALRWLADRVEYRVWRGGPDAEATSTMVHAWTYTGPHIPRPEQPRLHLNLWRISGTPAANQEVVFSDFRFVPADDVTAVGDELPPLRSGQLAGWITTATPNPFNPRTTVRFTLLRDGWTALQIFDLNGRLVRTLVDEMLGAGEHRRSWDGRNAQGRTLASGVYFARLSGTDYQDSHPVVLLK